MSFDPGLFQSHFVNLLRTTQARGGVAWYLAALGGKQRVFKKALDPGALDDLDMDKIEVLLDLVFTARRKLYPALVGMGNTRLREHVKALFSIKQPVLLRLRSFAGAFAADPADDRESVKRAAKMRRAAFDFAAEMLHFSAPETYPLMTRWVWDVATVSGALRELIRGNEHMREIPLGDTSETFEAARLWIIERIAEQGIYRDEHFWVDLVLAQAYSEYLRSMGEGLLTMDFTRGSVEPDEQVKKLLGIEQMRRGGRLRVKKEIA
ncbi:MAG: hypothetical protein ACREUA_08310 [Burkholderiales bacterium]